MHNKNILLIGMLLYFALFVNSKCDKKDQNNVVIPSSDATPPSAALTVNDAVSNLNIDQTSGPVNFQARDTTLTAIAGGIDNDGGVKSVKLFAEYTYYKPGQISGPTLVGAPIKENISPAQVGATTPKNLFLQHNFNLKTDRGGWSSIRLNLWVETENFHGGKARTQNVTVTYP